MKLRGNNMNVSTIITSDNQVHVNKTGNFNQTVLTVGQNPAYPNIIPVPGTYSQAPVLYQQYPNAINPAVYTSPVQPLNHQAINQNYQNPPSAYAQPYNNPGNPQSYNNHGNPPSYNNPGNPPSYNNPGNPLSYNNPEAINHLSFTTLVPVVQLDLEKAYNGIKICNVCNEKFNLDPDIRALPCGHPYHGKCIYNYMIVGNRKQCLHCLRMYA